MSRIEVVCLIEACVNGLCCNGPAGCYAKYFNRISWLIGSRVLVHSTLMQWSNFPVCLVPETNLAVVGTLLWARGHLVQVTTQALGVVVSSTTSPGLV